MIKRILLILLVLFYFGCSVEMNLADEASRETIKECMRRQLEVPNVTCVVSGIEQVGGAIATRCVCKSERK